MGVHSDESSSSKHDFDQDEATLGGRLAIFLNPNDGRFEDLGRGDLKMNVFRDFAAGLVVSMIAIPLAMGFAIASGLRPEQGIVGGAVAGLVGALWGGSKYQVYGPTAAFIPLIAGMMAKHPHSFLVLASVLAGLILMVMGVARLGRHVSRVPHSIVVGFTLGISATIAFSMVGEVLGLDAKVPATNLLGKLSHIWQHRAEANIWAVGLALMTFAITKRLLKVSVFIPAPLIAIGACTILTNSVLTTKGLIEVKDRYGAIPSQLLHITAPEMPTWTAAYIGDLAYLVFGIVFVAAIESLLCSRMADRLANNQGIPFRPNKELWGQGLVNILVPLFNGFPHTGALARTATNIRLGAISPLAGVFKFVLKLLLAAFLAHFLEGVPMACIGGILMYVAYGMIKKEEVAEVLAGTRFHVGLMCYTAVMVFVTDFLTGVLTAMALWLVLARFLEKTPVGTAE